MRPRSYLIALVLVVIGVSSTASDAAVTSFGSGHGPYMGVVVAPNGDVFATNESAHAVVHFDATGAFIGSFGTYGNGDGHLKDPLGLTFLQNGDLLVSDLAYETPPAQEFTTAGTFVKAFGQASQGDSATEDAKLDSSGNVFLDVQADRIEKQSPTGTYLDTFSPGLYSVREIALGPLNGHIYAPDALNPGVLELTNDGNIVAAWGTSGLGVLSEPQGVATAPNGDVFVADGSVLKINRYSSSGTYISSFLPNVAGVWGTGHYLAYAGSALYLAGPSSLVKIDLGIPVATITGNSSSPVTSQQVTFDASGSFEPFGTITNYRWDLDGSGNFATDTGTAPTVSRQFNEAGTTTVSVRVTGSSGQTATTNVAVVTSPSHASIAASSSRALTGQAVTFDASGSALANSSITDYRWDLDGSGSFATDTGPTPSLTNTFTTPGTVSVGVRVYRAGGVVDTASAEVTILLAPPSGMVGVTINDGDFATNNPTVRLSLVWPPFTTQVLISNQGGFGPTGHTSTLPVEATVPWTLQTTGSERLPKTVYLRFLGAGYDLQNFTSDIVLDQTPPTLQSASLVGGGSANSASRAITSRSKIGSKLRTYRLRIKARDLVSGVCAVKASSRRSGGSVAVIANCHRRGILRLSQIVRVKVARKPSYVRVRNSAGSWSRWLKLR